ncbi:reverse transcriptase domain-containing protein [Tanacetum coccineum]
MDDEPMWAADDVVAPTPGSAITIPETATEFAIKADEGSSNSNTDKIMARMEAMTLKMDAQYKELQTHSKKTNPDLDEDNIPMSREEEAKFMQTFLIRVKQKQLNLRIGTERMIYNIDSAMKHSYSNDDTCFSIDVIDEILEEDFDALLDEGGKILYFIEGTLLEEEIFAEFDEFMAMTAHQNSDADSDTKDPPFKKITINTDYKIKTSLEEPPKDVKLKSLPDNLEYVFLEEPSFLPIIISSQLSKEKKNKLIFVLKKHKQAFAWKTTDIPGICPSFCKHKIQLLKDKKPVVQKQRRLNPNMQEVVKKEIMKLLDIGIIYPIADSPWVSLIHCVPKKSGITVVTNKNDELVPTRTVTGWRVCIDYRKLNEATAKDHFPLPFMDQMLERLAGNKYFCFLDGFSGYFQIPIDPNDQEKTTFTCPFRTYAYRRMPFGLCNASATFQRYAHLVLNWEKCHFMVKEGIVLGHKVSSAGLEVDKAKIDVISKLPPPANIKSIRSFLRHASFYRRLIKDFSKIARPLTKLLKKDTPFEFDDECQKAFVSLKEKLTCAPVIVSPNWNLLFELMCDASDFAVGVVLDLRHLFKKQDPKPRFIRWVLFLQEFDIEIKDIKGTKNVAADHLSRIKNDETSDDSEVDDNFPGETLMEINTVSEPKLNDALWAFRTAYKTPTGTTPYKLIYGKNCHLPFEIEHRAYWALKNCNPDLIAAGTLALRYGKLRSMLKIALLQLCISLCPGKYRSPLIFPILSLLSVITLRAMFNLNDIIFASTDPALCETFSEIMCSKFKMSMMGKMSFFLRLQISQSPRGIFLNQSKYALEIIKKYGMETNDPVDTPMVEKSKLDEDPQGLWYSKDSCIALTAFADADHAGCQDTRSTSGSMQMLCSNPLDAITTDRLWPWIQLNSSISLHKEQVENGVVELYFVRTEYQLADIFIKALGRERLHFLINKLGMRSMSPETLKD